MISLSCRVSRWGSPRASFSKKTAFKGVSSGFVLELPTYRMPSFKGTVLQHVAEGEGFHHSRWHGHLLMSVVIWLLQNFTPTLAVAQDAGESILGVFGTAIAPVFGPLGFGNWQGIGGAADRSGRQGGGSFHNERAVRRGRGSSAVLSGLLGSVFTPLTGYSFPRYLRCCTCPACPRLPRSSANGRLEMGVRRRRVSRQGLAYLAALAVTKSAACL